MIHWLYTFPLWNVILLMVVILALWGASGARICASRRQWGNSALCAISIALILYTTLISRTPGTYDVVLTPFAALAAARQQPELYREMLMNVFLFFPLGLTLSNALPQPWRRWRRIAITVAFGCIFSAAIEFAQYRFSLGMAEMDDVICNTLGAFIGATSLLLSHVVEIIRKGPKT